MFVTVGADGLAKLEEPDNFKAFKIIVPAGDRPPSLAEIGRCEGDHVWVARAWLEQHGRPQDADWMAGLETMIAYAQAAGWVDDSGAIRAHIEQV